MFCLWVRCSCVGVFGMLLCACARVNVCVQVMQTLCEAEQVCVELQQSVSGLDCRLAELLHWESEARELYHVLKAAERRAPAGQDSRARVRLTQPRGKSPRRDI